MKTTMIGAFVAVLWAAGAAQAGTFVELLTNGDFESGDTRGWTSSGTSWNVSSGVVSNYNIHALDNSHFALPAFQADSSSRVLTQRTDLLLLPLPLLVNKVHVTANAIYAIDGINLKVDFLTGSGTAVGSHDMGTYYGTAAGNAWIDETLTIPTNTRYIDFVATGILRQGTVVDAGFDRASMQVELGAGWVQVAPTVSISRNYILETDWTELDGSPAKGPWNSVTHKVEIIAVGTADAFPNPPFVLTYAWTIHKPGGGSILLAETGPVLNLTLADIASLGLPDYDGEYSPTYIWNLSVTANIETYYGVISSSPAIVTVFVPEPATLSLLTLGGLTMLRRRNISRIKRKGVDL